MPHTLTLLAIALGLLALWGLVALLRGLAHVVSARSRIAIIVEQHLETLARRKLTLVKTDHYGIIDESGWRKEYRYFVDKVLLPELGARERAAILFRREALLEELVAVPVAKRTRELEASLAMAQDISPAEFEKWCSSALHEAGWSARATGTSGDQGADVIAEKAGVTIVLQCKLHRSAIGNKAVQEAFTAQKHYGAQAAAVVTNAAFTRSAEALSRTTGVLLCHYSDLPRLDDLLAARAAPG
ncbi:restriction system protein [Rhizobiales bacterium GAS191]|nr:restriction system protein [Rhizobiales bacterium GAS113]SEE17702.1 restriction system protein [Rhizobiales bacterium GAS191]